MGLENFCREPCFSNLRNNMRTLVEVLASVVAGLPQQHHGFYRSEMSHCGGRPKRSLAFINKDLIVFGLRVSEINTEYLSVIDTFVLLLVFLFFL